MAFSSYGTTITKGGTAIGEVTSISLGGSSLAEIDVTTLTDSVKAFKTGSETAGTISLEVFTPANYSSGIDALVPTAAQSSADSFVITWGNSSGTYITASFSGFITSVSISAQNDAAVTSSVNIRITGAITWSN